MRKLACPPAVGSARDHLSNADYKTKDVCDEYRQTVQERSVFLQCIAYSCSLKTRESPSHDSHGLGCSPDWLRTTLLHRLARWSEEPKLNTAESSVACPH
ncbi:hypothetical protein LSAT2_008124 [Lamellibrachia satsuma]|nr:hypothetical protein LSAT2_008124 [Lamellibrachia satsuma]